MKTSAAVAFEAKKPLEIVELDLEGPKAGEVLVEIMATGICHTDAYTLDGLDSEGVFPSVLGHEGAGIVREVGAGVTSVKPGDHVIPLYTPECRQCKSCLSGKTNLCTAIRATQGKGLMPDGTSRFSYKGQTVFHYMGCSTFSNFTVLPEIAVAKIRTDAPFDKACYVGCGVTTGVGAVVNTAKVQVGENVVVFGLGGIGLNVIQGARMAGADMIVGVDINPSKEEWGRRFGMTHFVNPKDVKDIVAHIVELTGGGADYSFDCTGNTTVMRQALECCHRGWGTSVIIGVAESGKEIATRPFQLVTGRNWRGTAFGGAKGRTDVPKIVDWYMNGKIEIDPMITHVMTLDKINDERSQSHFLGLIYEFLLLVRVGAEPQLHAGIAYALHNLPSMLDAEEWTPSHSDTCWREIQAAARLSGAIDWLLDTDQRMLERARIGNPPVPKWVSGG